MSYAGTGKQIKSFLDELTSLTDNTNQQLMFLNKAVMVLKEPGFKSPDAKSESRVYMNLNNRQSISLYSRDQVMGNGALFIISRNF